MSILEEKLEEIERKVTKLVEQNLQFKEICEDLLAVRRRLEKENTTLKQQLAGATQRAEELAQHTQALARTYEADKEGTTQQIDHYIQAIDQTVDWLRQL